MNYELEQTKMYFPIFLIIFFTMNGKLNKATDALLGSTGFTVILAVSTSAALQQQRKITFTKKGN